MTTNLARSSTLLHALRASIDGDRNALVDLYTPDVKAWAPGVQASSVHELLDHYQRRDDAFSEVEFDATPLDVGGDYACVEWRVTMTHSGKLELRDGAVVEPTGLRITVNGATVAEFDGDRICGLRQYWDELSVFEQLGLFEGNR